MGPFMVGVKKKKKNLKTFLELVSTKNIYMKQILVKKIEKSNISFNSCGGGDFSQAYIIMHEYFGL